MIVCRRVALEDIEEELQLCQILIPEEVNDTARILFNNSVCFVRDKLFDYNFKHLGLCLRLQPEVCIKLLTDEGLVNLV